MSNTAIKDNNKKQLQIVLGGGALLKINIQFLQAIPRFLFIIYE